MKRRVIDLAVGLLLALAIACGGGAKSVAPPRSQDLHAEIDRLDREITSQMQTLAEPRPAAPVAACVQNCLEPLASNVEQVRATDATCSPPQTETCTQACTLKTSICDNAAKICTLAADLGGNDAHANDVCNRGVASCEAAKKRCCSCM